MDAFTEIGVFVRVVDARGFTRAGQGLGLTASGVSRVVSRLEARLGVRLLDRTTRSLSLTDDGAAYYERCKVILADLEDADQNVARSRNEVRGRLRVDVPPVLGRHVLGLAIPRLLARHPDLAIDLTVRDELIDPIAEGVDVTIRMADPKESTLVSKRLGTFRFVLVASPAYLAQRGRPAHPTDLREHETIGFLSNGAPLPWRFAGSTIPVHGRLHTNSPDVLRDAAVAGFGLVRTFEAHVRKELERGDLVTVLDAYDLPRRKLNLGWDLFYRARWAYYRPLGDEVTQAWPSLNVFVEYRVSPAWNLHAEVITVSNHTAPMRIDSYSGRKGLSPLLYRDDKRLNVGPVLMLRVRRTFQ